MFASAKDRFSDVVRAILPLEIYLLLRFEGVGRFQ